ncbi:FKBP-type peptidyl-prolyl cis-trans isomerase [Candidatus Micrarchaeota archaeon]|nr:FKBP-type peptidyl-prolyl cis-trans isomerase [Candidatus Micrarchaeota archaeon]
MDKTKLFAGLLVALAVIAVACYFTQKAPETLAKIVEAGDVVAFDYILRVQGEQRVFDTTIQDVAIAENMFIPEKRYLPLEVTVGPESSGLLKDFDAALVGMREGDSKNLTLSPDRAYGARRDNLTRAIELTYPVPRVQEKPLAEFISAYGEVKENDSIKVGFWNVFILSVSNDSVVFRSDPSEGKAFSIRYFTVPLNPTATSVVYIEHVSAKITSVSNESFSYSINVENGERYTARRPTINAETGEVLLGSATPISIFGVNETHAVLDFNNPLAGKTLEFQIFMRNVTKKTGA